jgi:transposase
MDDEVEVGAGRAGRAPDAGTDGPAPPRRRRMWAGRKREAVPRLPRGEDLELVSRMLGATAAEPSGWREAFMVAGEASMRSRPADARDAEIGRLKEEAGELTMATELLEAKIARLEAASPSARRGSRR